MKRAGIAIILLAALASAGLLSGCGGSTTNSNGQAPSASVPVGPADLGVLSLGLFVPRGAFPLIDGVAAVGQGPGSPGATLPEVVTSLGGKKWQVTPVGDKPYEAAGAVSLQTNRVVVGAAGAGANRTPFASASINGAAFVASDLTSLFANRAGELTGVSLTGLPDSGDTFVMACGNVVRKAGQTLGDPKSTQPIVIGSHDGGTTWKQTGPLPMPPGVDGAEALTITSSPHAQYSGVLVVGVGWTTTGHHQIGVVWGTPDQGASWKVISNMAFTNKTLQVRPVLIGAGTDTIIVAGTAEPIHGAKRSATVLWIADANGTWHVWDDSQQLPAGRSSIPTAVIARDTGGFILTKELYDTAAGPFAPNKTGSNPSVTVIASMGGITWHDVASAVPGISSAATVNGIAEFGSRMVFVGIDKQSKAQAFVASASDLP